VWTVKHKNQHTVPQSNLKAWCDPNCPEGHEPYIWIGDKAGAGARKKAPAKVFTEKAFYTIRLVDGERTSCWSTVRVPLPHVRHERSREGSFWREQWQRVLDMGQRDAGPHGMRILQRMPRGWPEPRPVVA
jgi:hypothetical protein